MRISEIKLLESEIVIADLKKIVSDGIKKGVENVARDLHDYASKSLHRVKRRSDVHGILDKIISNPTFIAKQLIKQTMDKDLPVLKNVS